METHMLLILVCSAVMTSAITVPFYPVRSIDTRFVAPPRPPGPAQYKVTEDSPSSDKDSWQRDKRNHEDDYYNNHHGNSNHHGNNNGGVTGPIHTFVKTDKNANYKWGVRHHVGPKYV